MGISHHLARQAFHSMHFGEIRDFNHWENLIAYIQRKKFSSEDMAHFRRMYPEPNACVTPPLPQPPTPASASLCFPYILRHAIKLVIAVKILSYTR
ncbi:hypothetical protein BpHYR1_000456 [Brachionus plicatilis]|uniref:Uncharacterized protein n=1 Tax=Brachionus plicatilis TaxID=10195 RepID=A0A3M7RMH2_BRAPC|nr:hypothetical protein BpHYR1_000456 [Brachionus plicatilis]